jgi:hypothetical protein
MMALIVKNTSRKMSKNQTETPGIKALPPSAAMFNTVLQGTPARVRFSAVYMS